MVLIDVILMYTNVIKIIGVDNMSDEGLKRFTLRIDEKIFNEIKTRSVKNKRSIAKEIEYILEEYLESESNKQ